MRYAIATKISRVLVLASAMAYACALAGCENFGSSADTSLKSTNTTATGSTGSLPSGAGASIFSISKVVLSSLDPTSSIDIIGSSGAIGAACPTVDSCQCRFDFTATGGTLQQRFQDPSYVENDLMRCLFTQVDATAGFYDVRIVVKASGLTSSTFRVSITAANPAFSPSILSNFIPVSRFMCRDVIRKSDFNTNNYGASVSANLLDPRVWDLSQSYNFYTTSLGADYGARSTSSLVFECPPIPNDQSFDSSIRYDLFSLASVDLNNPSTLPPNPPGDFPPGTGDNTIFPSDDNKNISNANCPTGDDANCEKFRVNRHDFYLSNFMDGIFRQPFCTIHTPANMTAGTLNCTVDSSKGTVVMGSTAQVNGGAGKDIIGFAALPDSNENCPSTAAVQIPSTLKWSKVWRFRASLTARSIQDLDNANEIGDLFCTTRNQECESNNAGTGAANTVFSVCHNSTNPHGQHLGPLTSLPFNGQTFGNCSSLGTIGDNWGDDPGDYLDEGLPCVGGTHANCCLDVNAASITTALRRAANFTPGGNFCNPALPGMALASNLGGLAEDVWLVGNGSASACVEADTDANGKIFLNGTPNPNPFRYTPKPVDTNSFFDFVYVVTPPSVKLSDMTDSNSLIRKQYSPRRKASDGVTNIDYQLASGSANSSTAIERLSTFPLCVLQVKK